MSRDHIIPRFILREFAINPKASKQRQKITIYNKLTNTITNEFVDDAFAIRDFNSKETESFLNTEFESDISCLFKSIKKSCIADKKEINLNLDEYKLLFRFMTVMWRRNNIHAERLKNFALELDSFLKNILGPIYNELRSDEYKDVEFETYLNDNIGKYEKDFYNKIIKNTTDDDYTVLKTIENYYPRIVYNKSNIHCILHNTYGTMNYMIKEGDKVTQYDYPYNMIFPISKEICICFYRIDYNIKLDEKEYKIKIENWDRDDDVRKFLIDFYITPTAEKFVVDDTNVEYVKNKIN